jgi:60 kDa SS-A/Ro ribonucleoprotein
MANKKLFNSVSNRGPVTNTVNQAGGVAYELSNESALAQYVVTGCLNQTYYASADEQVDKVLELAGKCSTEFVAKAAVYGHRVARMKDTPALLANVLANRGEEGLRYLELVFPQVISGTKMLRNFVQILRSGRCGRKSFGSATKRFINSWLANQEAEALFRQSVGNDPSLADIVKMSHPKPKNKAQEAFYAWLLGKDYQTRYLPKLIKEFESFKQGKSEVVPDVDFRMLSNEFARIGAEGWKEFARKGGWNFLRMNLNNLQKYGCFADKDFVKEVTTKLADEKLVRIANAFPYQLLTTFQNVQAEVPTSIKLALQDAMEIATTNVPKLEGKTAVCIDTSGSMGSFITGNRGLGATSKTTCVDVAGLMAASIVRVNPDTDIVPFDTAVRLVDFNPRDSVMTNARKFARNGGGTDCGSALRYLNGNNWKGDTVIFVSDNESWYTPSNSALVAYYGRKTGMVSEWQILKKRNPKAKLVCIDIQPGSTTQVPDDKSVLNVGGFSDAVFEVVANFVNGDSQDFVKVIKEKVNLED